jgi:5-methylcytosine-specific restriction endonuclease McrBC regulatory subunit McrC
MKLSKEEWTQFDGLLGKLGFGGYYDLMACLKMIVMNLTPEINQGQKDIIGKEYDMQTLVLLIIKLSKSKTVT